MDEPSRRALVIVMAIIAIPCVFFIILMGWSMIDYAFGVREVSRFIRDHRAIVAARSADPKVYSFSPSHDPNWPAALLIQFDVEDKATYLMLEEDLSGIWRLRFPARWETHLRSKEDLGNNFGFAAQSIGEAAEFIQRVLIAAVASICLSAGWLVFARLRL